MEKYVVLYNGLADNGAGFENAKHLAGVLKDDELDFVDLVGKDIVGTVKTYDKDQRFILAGGDGTINYFVNHIDEDDIPENLFYYSAGSGSDFYRDVSEKENIDGILRLNKYVKNLPVCEVNGKSMKFIDNVGYGIDGYVCEVADGLKEKTGKTISYASIAIKGLLYGFSSRKAKITVDGKEYHFNNVWLSPVMKGKYYGGGMMPCPLQDRDNEELSVLVWDQKWRLGALAMFKGLFDGSHLKHEKICRVYTGKHIIVEFEKPCAAQVDGETEINVSKIECRA